MDLSTSVSVIVKLEPGIGGEGGGKITNAELNIEIPDIKTECLEYSLKTDQTTGKKIYSFTDKCPLKTLQRTNEKKSLWKENILWVEQWLL